MIHLVLTIGSMHGWGTVGRYLTREMARLTPVRLITTAWPADLPPLEQRFLESLASIVPRGPQPKLSVEGSVLQFVKSDFSYGIAEVSGSRSVACIVFEFDSVVPAALERAKRFDEIAVASEWCRGILNNAGLQNVFVATQGIDPLLFNPHQNRKEFSPEIFTVFSGGKLEYRKGQDLVIRAFKVLQDRHRDVMLVTAWYNPWPVTMNTMLASPHIQIPKSSGAFEVVMRELLNANGIDPARSIVLGPIHHSMLSRIYKDTDIGLFPNRCEGGTNLVMMEYMACGKPVIASYNTGQIDVLSDQHAIPIRKMKPIQATMEGQPTTFFEADLEETVEHLEWAYQNRDRTRALGDAAGEAMKQFTWVHTAEALRKHL